MLWIAVIRCTFPCFTNSCREPCEAICWTCGWKGKKWTKKGYSDWSTAFRKDCKRFMTWRRRTIASTWIPYSAATGFSSSQTCPRQRVASGLCRFELLQHGLTRRPIAVPERTAAQQLELHYDKADWELNKRWLFQSGADSAHGDQWKHTAAFLLLAKNW